MSILEFAKKELDLIGMTEDNADEMNRWMRKHVLHMVEEFTKEGHSGFSAAYAVNLINKLLRYEPLTPLTGEDDEWMEVGFDGDNGGRLYQNKRSGRVFKNDNGAYDIEGIIFYDIHHDEDGVEYKSHFTSFESRVPVKFPYTPTSEYRKRHEYE